MCLCVCVGIYTQGLVSFYMKKKEIDAVEHWEEISEKKDICESICLFPDG